MYVSLSTLACAWKIIIAFTLAAAYRVHLHSHSGDYNFTVVVVVVVVSGLSFASECTVKRFCIPHSTDTGSQDACTRDTAPISLGGPHENENA